MPRELLMMQNSFQWGTAEGQTLQLNNAIRSNIRDLKIEGQTYQNFCTYEGEFFNDSGNYKAVEELTNLKSKTTYTVEVDLKSDKDFTSNNKSNIFRVDQYDINENGGLGNGVQGIITSTYQTFKFTFTTVSNFKRAILILRNNFNDTNVGLDSNTMYAKNIKVIEGDHTNTDLPAYINGIESVAEREKEGDLYSVKITNKGKNLLDLSTFTPVSTSAIQASKEGNVITIKGSKTDTEESYTYPAACNLKVYLEENKTYTFSFKSDGEFGGTVGTDTVELLFMLDGTTKNYFKVQGQNTVTIPRGFTGYYYVRFDVNSGDKTHKFWDIQVEEGDTVTDYEPYREPTLTEISLPQPLRSLPNGVCDEIVGNKLIQRVGVFNASKNYSSAKWMGSSSPFLEFDFMQGSVRQNDNVYCNTLPYNLLGYSAEHNKKGFSTQVGFRIKPFEEDNKSRQEYETWLEENETIIYYELATPIEHTINVPRVPIAKGSNIITTTNNIKPNLSIKYKEAKRKKSTPTNTYLYNEGNECLDITGGWRLTHKGSYAENYMVKNTDNIEVYGVSGSSGIEVSTTNKINWEDYDSICYEIEKINVGDKGIFVANFVDVIGSSAWENTQVTQGFDADTLDDTFTIKFKKPNNLPFTNGHVGLFTDHYWQQTDNCPMKFKIKKVWLEKSDTTTLYSNGNENTKLTGGYSINTNNPTTCNIEKQADNLYVNCTGKMSFDSMCYARTNKTIKPCKIKVNINANYISANGIAFCMFLSEKETISTVSEFNSIINKKYIKASNTTQGQYIDLEIDLTDNTEGYFYVFCMTAGSADYTCKANIRKIEIIR